MKGDKGMLSSIRVNLEEIESMLYFWQATKEREKVSEVYLHELADAPGLAASYDAGFSAESVRKVLSAITNRERLSSTTPKEGRFWNNNMWMMEDLGYTGMMAAPLKKLNVDYLAQELKSCAGAERFEQLEVRFSPLSTEEYIISGNRLIINFFRTKPDDVDETAVTIGGQDIKEFIREKLRELLAG